jgi:hypothetical protein
MESRTVYIHDEQPHAVGHHALKGDLKSVGRPVGRRVEAIPPQQAMRGAARDVGDP